MEKINTRTLSGFIELLPPQQAVFDEAKSIIEESYLNAGYVKIETPAVERLEILLAKSGGEMDKQIFRIAKEDTEQALRFDLTVPFARYVAQHYGALTFPFKRYQIDKSWRGERAQKGRYRELYQADIDVVAEDELNILYDADVIAAVAAAMAKLAKRFGFGGFKFKISNRKVWEGLLASLGFADDVKRAVLALVDDKFKIEAAEFDTRLRKICGNDDAYRAIDALLKCEYIKKIGISAPDALHSCLALHISTPLMKEGIDEIETVMGALGETAAAENVEVDFAIIRGHDYYTGIVFEIFLDDMPGIGAVGSGGRYANLCGSYIDKNIIGVGGSIGLSRLMFVLFEDKAVEAGKPALDVLVLPMGSAHFKAALEVANRISAFARASAIYEDRKFKKLMEYADKMGAKYVVIIGDDEAAGGKLTLKNMTDGSQITDRAETIIANLKKN
ncbi:MAG: histidine--tRNA ligase [Alphaproteobacteria bacterium]|nr:histidine--tRNA ligase [Alphaproteobacteria bacterium]